MSKVNFFAQGLGLKPASADPASPSDGQLYMSDGTVRGAGLWRYSSTSSAWVAVGAGGGGLDVFHTEDFESNKAADHTSGNAATVDAAGTGTLDGTLADEESAQFAGDRSLKYTMGSSSANDFFLQDADIAVELKQTSNDIGVSFYYTYNGDDDDVRFFVLDQDDVELSSSIEFIKAKPTPTRFTTSFYLPVSSTGLRYGFQVGTGNSAKVLIVDDFELSTNPFVYKNLIEMTAWTSYTPATQGFGASPTSELRYRRVGDSLEIQGELTADTSTAVEAQVNLPTGLSVLTGITGPISCGAYFNKNSASSSGGSVLITGGDTFINFSSRATFDTGAATALTPAQGDGTGVNEVLTGTDTMSFTVTIPIEGWSASSEHVVTPASATTEIVAYSGYTALVSSKVQLATEVLNTSSQLISLDNTSFTKITALKPINIIASASGRRSAGVADIGVRVFNSSNVLLFQTVNLQDTANNNASSTLNYQMSVGDYVVFYTGDVMTNDALTTFSVTASPIEVNFLAAIPVQKVAYVSHNETSGTAGGASTANTVQVRDLNTISGPDSEIVSLSTKRFKLQTGKYTLDGMATGFEVNAHQLFFYNYTTGTYIEDGLAGQNIDSSVVATTVLVSTTLNVSGETEFELRHWTQTAQATTGLGVPSDIHSSNPQTKELYAQVKITKLR